MCADSVLLKEGNICPRRQFSSLSDFGPFLFYFPRSRNTHNYIPGGQPGIHKIRKRHFGREHFSGAQAVRRRENFNYARQCTTLSDHRKQPGDDYGGDYLRFHLQP